MPSPEYVKVLAAESHIKRAYQELDRNVPYARQLFAEGAKLYDDASRLAASVDKKKYSDLADKYRALSLAKEFNQTQNTTVSTVKVNKVKQDNSDEQNKEKTLEEALVDLEELIGLDNVKEIVHGWIKRNAVFEQRKKLNLPSPSGMSYHMVFTGRPGTGKTTIARILGDIYKALGIIEKSEVLEVHRNTLVGGYVGQTALKTKEVIEKALGGILFIDEAYALAQGGENDFGKEAIQTLLHEMENHRHELVVIVAGYEKEMEHFLSTNEGLASRFKTVVNFPDYTPEELFKIFKLDLDKYGYVLSNEAERELKRYIPTLYHKKGFANGRDMRNIFEKTINKQAIRLADKGFLDEKTLQTILPEDLSF